MDILTTLQELVSIPAPSGQEEKVRRYLESKISSKCEIDVKGNLLVNFSSDPPKVVVTAHMDEIAMFATSVDCDGIIKVSALGGLHPWKLGEASHNSL